MSALRFDYSSAGNSRQEIQRMIDWDKLVEREGPFVWRTVWRILGNHADADEVFQETFVGALRYSQTRAVTHWRALLQRLATARAIDRLRQLVKRQGREEALPEDLAVAVQGHPLQPALDAEFSERLREALAIVPANHAEVFCLFHLEDWTYPEIAEHLGIPIEVVGVWLHRVRGKLRELLHGINEVSS